MVQSYGSVDRPVSLDPFQVIREVHWGGGGVVIVEAEFLQGVQFFAVNVLAPEDITVLSFGGNEVVATDYQNDTNWYANRIGDYFVINEHILWEDELTDIWIWDAFLINALGDDTGVDDAVRIYGDFDLHFEGMQVAYDTEHFGRPLLGDYITHTHPSGHKVTYANGATPLGLAYIQWQAPPESGGTLYSGIAIRPSDPRGVPPLQDLSGTESWYWYHLGHAPQAEVVKVRQSWLVYFKADRTGVAELFNGAITLPETCAYSIKGYPDGTGFDIHEAHATAKNGVLPTWQVSGTIPATFDGQVKKFTSAGVIS